MKIVYSKYPFNEEREVTRSYVPGIPDRGYIDIAGSYAPAAGGAATPSAGGGGTAEDFNSTEKKWVIIEGGYRSYISEEARRVFDAVEMWSSYNDGDEQEIKNEEMQYLITEKNYVDLRSAVDSFLDVRAKSRQTPGSRFVDYEDGVMKFKTDSHRLPDTVYDQEVKLLDLDGIIRDNPGKGKVDIARMALKGNIAVHCTDPSWLYFGFQYIGTKSGYAINPEDRAPVVRNPGQRGSVCKHLDNVLYILPFQATKLAAYL